MKSYNINFYRWLVILALCIGGNSTNLLAQDAVAVSKSVIGGISLIETGVPFQYQVTLRCDNTGVDACTNFVLDETLPLGLEFTSATASDVFSVGGTFGSNNPPLISNFNSGDDPTFTTPGSIRLDFGDVAPGSSVTVSFNVRFHKNGDVPDGYMVTNTATITSDNDVDTGNNSVTSPSIEAQASSAWTIRKGIASNFALGLTTVYEIGISGPTNNVPTYYVEDRKGQLALYNPIVVDILETGLTCADVDASVTSGMSTGDAICLAPGASGTLTSGIMFTNPSGTNYALVFDHEAITSLQTPYRPNATMPPTGTTGVNIEQDIMVGIIYDNPPFMDGQTVTNNAELWGSFPTSLGGTTLTPIAFLDDDAVNHTVHDPNGNGNFIKLSSGQLRYVGQNVSFTLRLTNTGNIPMTDVVFRDTLPSEMGDIYRLRFSNSVTEDKTITLTFTDGTTQIFTLLAGDNEANVGTDFTIPAGEQIEIIEVAMDGELIPGGFGIQWDMTIDGQVLPTRFRDDTHTDRYDNPAQSPDIDLGGQLSGSNVVPDEELTNCGRYTANTALGSLSGSACAYKLIVPHFIVVQPTKTVVPSTPQAPGTTLTFTLSFGGPTGGLIVPYDDLTTFTLVDTLPVGLSYVPGSATVNDGSILTTTLTPNVGGSDRDLVVFEVDRNGNSIRLSRGGTVTFQVMIESDHTAGTFDNTHFITDFTGNNNELVMLTANQNNPLIIRIDTSGFTTPLAGSAPNDISAPPPYNAADASYQVVALPAGASIKFVDANLTPGQTGSGGVELGSPGSVATFTLLFENVGNDTLDNLRLIDLLPRIGDTSPLTCTPRNTEWEPDFAGNITTNFISEGVTAAVSPTIEYSTDIDPCVEYWVPGPEPCGACNMGTFSTTPPATLGDVLALGFDFGALKIPPSDSILVSFEVAIPNSPTPEGIAWNTFAWSGVGLISGAEVGAEPPLVGVATDEFDLALYKIFNPSFTYPPILGDTIIFDLFIINQGEFTGFDIDVVDYFDSTEINFIEFLPFPTTTLSGAAVNVNLTDADPIDEQVGFEIDSLATLDTVQISVRFRIDPNFMGTEVNNAGEVTAGSVFDGGATTFDIDSSLDSLGGNGANEVNNDVDDTITGGTDNPTDQDDYDFELVQICSYEIAAVSSNPTTCGGNDGSITFTFTNVPDGTYNINYQDAVPNTQTFTNISVTSGSATIAGLSAGTYNNLTIINGSCMSTEDVDILLTNPDAPTISTTPTDETCALNDGSIQVNISGGISPYDIDWSDGGTNTGTAMNQTSPYTIMNLPPATYSISVTDNVGCIATATETIMATMGLPDISFTLSDTTVCDQTDAVPILSGSESGFFYQLRNDADDSNIGSPVAGTGGAISFTISNLTPEGTYTYNVLAYNPTTGCSAEITDKAVIEVVGCDYQDYLPTCANPPCHITSADLYLGSGVSSEASTMGTVNADTDDDDGILIPNNIRPGITIRFPTTIYNNTGQTAYLTGWIDWNGDQDFDDPGEQIANEIYDYATYNGTFQVPISVNVPSNALQEQNLAVRYRLSSSQADISTPCGSAACAVDGEIEDYLIQVECPPQICLPIGIAIKRN